MPSNIPTALVAVCVTALLAALGAIWRESKKYQKLWILEVRRNVYYAMRPPPGDRQLPTPPRAPEENTISRRIRDEVSQKELDNYLEHMDRAWDPNESTPP